MIETISVVPTPRAPYRTRQVGVSPYADARLALGWTQRHVAQRAGVTVQTVKRLERGNSDVCRATRLAVRFALSMPWIEEGEP